MQLGEVVFGGVGAGLYGMLVMVVLTVFIAGLMVGRTPEYLGKKIQAREVQMAMLYVLVFPLVILALTGRLGRAARGAQGPQQRRAARPLRDPLRLHLDAGQQRQRLRRPHGIDLLLQHLFGVATLIGRFAMIVPMLALGGLPRREEDRARVGGHLPGHDAAVRRCCSIGVILIVGALTFFPALVARPDRRAPRSMQAGRLF